MAKTKDFREPLSLVAVGDIYVNVGHMYVNYDDQTSIPDREDPTSIFALVLPFLEQADFLFGNLEIPLSDRGTEILGKSLYLRSMPSSVQALVAAGFNAVGLANNHTLDFGAEALLQTIEVLDKVKIGHAGAGHNAAEAHKPAIVEKRGIRVALLSYSSVFMPGWAAKKNSPGMSVVRVNTAYQPPARVFEMPGMPAIVITSPEPVDLETMKLDIKNARAQADIVVISWHWGRSEGYRDIMDYQVELGHMAVDAGADLVFGHHSHAPQGIEIYKGKAIFYGMGNFAFDIHHPIFAKESLALRCQIHDKCIERVSFLPVRINQKLQPEVLDTAQGRDIISLIQKASDKFSTRFSIGRDEVVVPIEN